MTQQILHYEFKTVTAGQTLGDTDPHDVEWDNNIGSTYTELPTGSMGLQTLGVRLAVATAALTGFRVLGKFHKDDAVWSVLASSAADFAGASPYVVQCRTFNASDAFQDTDITTMAAAQYAVLVLAVPEIAFLKFEADGAATTVVTAWGAASSEGRDLGGAVGLLRDVISPQVVAPQAAVTQTDDNWKEAFTIPANCVFARVHFSQAAYSMPGTTGSNPAQNGPPYQPNILYDIPTGGTYNRLFVRNVGAGVNVTTGGKFYCTA